MSYRTVTDPTQRIRPVVIEYPPTEAEYADDTEGEGPSPGGPELPNHDDQQIRGDRDGTDS